jgi:ABC-type transporter MlaC component
MVLTQRDEFASVIQTNNGGIEALLERLRKKT